MLYDNSSAVDNNSKGRSLPQHHLILGGCGFIGRHVALLLVRAGCRVTLSDRAPLGRDLPEGYAEQIVWRPDDFSSIDWDAAVADADVVHHYAWSSIPASANADPRADLQTNVGMTIDMLEAMRRRGGRVVFASSGGTVYGAPRRIPVPEDHAVAPISAYGAGKVAAEAYLSLYRSLYGLDCRIARIANPYGAGQDISRGLGSATTFLYNALTERPITIWGTGEVVRDFVHIADVARGLVTLASAPRNDEYVFNIGSGAGTSLNDIISILEAKLGRTLKVAQFKSRAFDVPINVLDISRIRAVFGWSPALSFSQGIDRTIEDLRQNFDFSTLDEAGAFQNSVSE